MKPPLTSQPRRRPAACLHSCLCLSRFQRWTQPLGPALEPWSHPSWRGTVGSPLTGTMNSSLGMASGPGWPDRQNFGDAKGMSGVTSCVHCCLESRGGWGSPAWVSTSPQEPSLASRLNHSDPRKKEDSRQEAGCLSLPVPALSSRGR